MSPKKYGRHSPLQTLLPGGTKRSHLLPAWTWLPRQAMILWLRVLPENMFYRNEELRRVANGNASRLQSTPVQNLLGAVVLKVRRFQGQILGVSTLIHSEPVAPIPNVSLEPAA